MFRPSGSKRPGKDGKDEKMADIRPGLAALAALEPRIPRAVQLARQSGSLLRLRLPTSSNVARRNSGKTQGQWGRPLPTRKELKRQKKERMAKRGVRRAKLFGQSIPVDNDKELGIDPDRDSGSGSGPRSDSDSDSDFGPGPEFDFTSDDEHDEEYERDLREEYQIPKPHSRDRDFARKYALSTHELLGRPHGAPPPAR